MPDLTILHGYRTLQLSRGFNTLIDEVDLDVVGQFKWHFRGEQRNGYATRNITVSPCRQKPIRLHRFLMNAPDNLKVDHKNGDALDNRRLNLRLATQQQNARNIRKTHGVSKYKGIWWWPQKRRWRAQINLGGQKRHVGVYRTEEDAARAYDRAAREHYGEFARTNADIHGDY